MKELTRAEEQIMHVLWEIEKGPVKDILDRLRFPYKVFGHDTSMILTLEYAKRIDAWWRAEGASAYRKQIETQVRA